MELLAQVVVSGLTLGSLYALVGLGFVVIYRATGVVNFGHGEMLMLGAMTALVLHVDMGIAYVFAFIIAVGGAGVLGAALERIAYRPLRFAPVVTVILATVAVGQIIRAGVRLVRGSEVSRFPSLVLHRAVHLRRRDANARPASASPAPRSCSSSSSSCSSAARASARACRRPRRTARRRRSWA